MELLTREQAAKRLGMSVSTLDSERCQGNLAYIQRKKNGKVWISEAAIQEYLARGTHEARPIRSAIPTYRKKLFSNAAVTNCNICASIGISR